MKVYLDNNATTPLYDDVRSTYEKWLAITSNPSTNTSSGLQSRSIIEECHKYLQDKFKVASNYNIIFNSGASEGNSHIITSIALSYDKPHIITSGIEHSSIMNATYKLATLGKISVTYIKPNMSSIIDVGKIKAKITSNTRLISIMFANNETGAVNDIKSIAALCKERNILFHSDITQVFGKLVNTLPLEDLGIAAVTGSFHKLYAPIGIGFEVIKAKSAFALPLIYGKQQSEIRGGTLSVGLIASALSAMKICFTDRKNKNQLMSNMQKKIVDELKSKYQVIYYKSYKDSSSLQDPYIVIFGDDKLVNRLPNTLLLSLVCKNMCNVKFKKYLDENGMIISIGSACNSDSKDASSVIKMLDVPDKLRKGIIRISMSDMNTTNDIDKLLSFIMRFPEIAVSL